MEGTKSVQRVRKREIVTKNFAIGRKDVTIVLTDGSKGWLLYTSDAADDLIGVVVGGGGGM